MSHETKAAWQIVASRLEFATGPRSYANSRVYPLVLPQQAKLPAYTYQQITGVREHAFNEDPGDVHARVQVDVYDKTFRGTASGARHARNALSRFAGTATGTEVDDIYLDNERENFMEDLEDGQRTVYRRTLDFIVHYQE